MQQAKTKARREVAGERGGSAVVQLSRQFLTGLVVGLVVGLVALVAGVLLMLVGLALGG